MSIDMLDASRGSVHAHPPFNRQPNHEFSQHVKVNGGEQLWLCHRSDWRNGLIFQSKQIFHVIWPDSNATAFEFPSTKYSNFQFVFCPFRSVQWIIRVQNHVSDVTIDCHRSSKPRVSSCSMNTIKWMWMQMQLLYASCIVVRCESNLEMSQSQLKLINVWFMDDTHCFFIDLCATASRDLAPTTTTTIIKWYII